MDQSDLKFSIDTAVYKRVSTGEKVNGPVLEAYQPTQRNNAATTPRRHLWCATITPLCNATGGASDWGCGEDNQQRGALSAVRQLVDVPNDSDLSIELAFGQFVFDDRLHTR